MITLNITRKDFGFVCSPIIKSFFRTYGLPGWDMCIGRDTGTLYQINTSGRSITFDLTPDAWVFNLRWSRNPTPKPDPCLLLTERPLLNMIKRTYV